MSVLAPVAREAPVPAPARPADPPPRPGGRALERRLLLFVLPVALAGVFAVTRSTGPIHPSLAEAARAFGLVIGACLALHVLFSLARFDGDPVVLPLLGLLFTVGTAYHLGLQRPGGGSYAGQYLTGVVVAAGVIGVVVLFAPWFRRLGMLFEEKVWWRVARDLPYYESAPFHLVLFGLMLVLVGWLLLRGRPEGASGAIVIVPLFGGLSFTPSEFIRLAVAFFLADYLSRNSRAMRNLRQPILNFFPLNRLTIEHRGQLGALLTTVFLYCALFILFRDFGPAAIVFGLTVLALGAATLRWTTPAILLAAIGVIVYLVGFAPGTASGVFQNRLAMWLDPWDTGFVNGDHQARILWGIASGGWFGIGSGVVNLRAALPEAARDTAFAGIATTMGVWVALCVLLFFGLLAWRGYAIARAAPTDRSRLLAFTLTSLLALQAVWICGAMVRLLPFSGINLPFVSTGLSSVVASAIALGALLNLSRRAAPHDGTEATPEVARGVRLLGWPVLAAFLLPAGGLLVYGAPWLLGDQTLVRPARTLGRLREPFTFRNPLLEQFRSQFPRGRVYSADGALLAVSRPSPADRELIRARTPEFSAYLERHRDDQRLYPLGSAAAQLVGWTTGGRFAGRSGSVESGFDAWLRGYREEDLARLFRARHNPLVRKPRPWDLRLTIDARTQRQAGRRLREAIRLGGGVGGALVVMDANSGQVLAAATEPSFDPNGLTVERMEALLKSNPRTQVLSNKALGKDATYFPGSTFKLLTAAAALEERPAGTAVCDGANERALTWREGSTSFRRPPGRIHDFSGGGHGTLDLRDNLDSALAASCNVFFATLATRVGAEGLHRAMEQAELSQLPAVERIAAYLPETGFGQVTVKTAPVELMRVAAAAGVATPSSDAQVAAAYPYWIDRVVKGNVVERPSGTTGTLSADPYRPFSPSVARQMRSMMLDVVNSPRGTAYAAFHGASGERLRGVTVGGKTGTAEFEKETTVKGKKVRSTGTHAWFVGFARNDREVQPRTLAFAVLVEDVKGRATGGRICAPAARNLLVDIFGPAEPEPEPPPEPEPQRPRWWELLNPRRWF